MKKSLELTEIIIQMIRENHSEKGDSGTESSLYFMETLEEDEGGDQGQTDTGAPPALPAAVLVVPVAVADQGTLVETPVDQAPVDQAVPSVPVTGTVVPAVDPNVPSPLTVLAKVAEEVAPVDPSDSAGPGPVPDEVPVSLAQSTQPVVVVVPPLAVPSLPAPAVVVSSSTEVLRLRKAPVQGHAPGVVVPTIPPPSGSQDYPDVGWNAPLPALYTYRGTFQLRPMVESQTVKDQAFNHKAVFPLPDKSVITEPGFIHSLKAFLEVLGLSRRNSLHLSLFSYLYNRFWDVCAGETRNFFIPCGGLQGVNGFLQQDGWRWAVPMLQPNGIVQPTLVQHWWIAFMHTHPLVYQSVLDSFRPFLPQLEGSYSAPLGEFFFWSERGPHQCLSCSGHP